MNPILELFQELQSKGDFTDDDVMRIMRDAREMLPFLGADLLKDLKRCLRDRDIQIQLWTVDLFEKVPMAYAEQARDLLERQLMVEERRTQRDNAELVETLQVAIEKLTTSTSTQKENRYNPMLLNMFQRVQNMDIEGGYARYQVQTDMLADARQWLASADEAFVPALQTVLQYNDPQIQIWGVRLCEDVPDKYRPDVIELLKTQLQTEDNSPQRNNVQLKNTIKNTLTKLGDNSVVETALKQLAPENERSIRSQALVTLGQDAQTHKADLLKVATDDDDLRIRQDAIRQLGKLSEDDSLIEIYEALYQDESVDIRAQVIRSVMQLHLKDPRIDALVIDALDDESDVMIEVIHGLETRNIPASVPKMMARLTEIKTGDVWQIARGLRSQMAKFRNLPDDCQPLYDLILNADDYPASAFSDYAVGALQGMPDLSAMPVLMAYMKRDVSYEGNPEKRPSFTALHTLRNMRRNIEWTEYERALEPYITSDDGDEQFNMARISVFAGEEDGYPILQRLRTYTTDPDLIKFIDKHLPA